MKISIVMASYLGNYQKAAMNRDEKIIRAIRSVEKQDYEDWELIVVADGCKETQRILKEVFWYEKRIKGFLIQKQKTWSGTPRNIGIEKATGDYVCYLDVDDMFGQSHLSGITEHLDGKDWYWFDDWVFSKSENNWRRRKCSVFRVGQCGTSNIIHKPIFSWDVRANYAHDWTFIKIMRKSKNFARIEAGEYCVCHIPGRIDV